MSWLFSQALVEAFSGGSSSGFGPFAQLRLMPTPHPFLLNDKTMDVSRFSRFGQTCGLLTADRGEALLTWFRGAFPVRTSARRGKGRGSRASGQGSGGTSHGFFAKFDRVSRSWKTRQFSLLGGLIEFSGTWPRWGSMRGGAVSRRQMPSGLAAHRAWITSVSGSGSSRRMPTASATDGMRGGVLTENMSGVSLAQAVNSSLRVPTPRSEDGVHSGVRPTPTTARRFAAGQANLSEAILEMQRVQTPTTKNNVRSSTFRAGRSPSLNELVQTVPTPIASCHRSGKVSQATMEKNARPLQEVIGGSLNPPWVEWLMGWPIGWTELGRLATDKFQEWLRSHGGC